MLIYGGVIAVVAIGGFLWWKNKNKPKTDEEIAPKPKIDAELTTPKGQKAVDVVSEPNVTPPTSLPSSPASQPTEANMMMVRGRLRPKKRDTSNFRRQYDFYKDSGGTLTFLQWMRTQKGKQETNSKASQNIA